MKKILPFIIGLLVIIGLAVVWYFSKTTSPIPVTNFAECAALGNPIMESYPRQCRYNGQTFVENIGNELDKVDLIRIETPRPNDVVVSPLVVKGQVRGNWFFEASFPVILTDWDGRIIAQGVAQAKGDWMTTEFVPFEATITFTVDENAYSNRGSLILKRDNPSGLPADDDALEIPIMFGKAEVGGSGGGSLGTGGNVGSGPTSGGTGILPFKSGISGTVTLGPTCPVMRNPPDPQCAEKPYQTTVQIIAVGSPKSSPFATVETDKNGYYKIMIPPGEYAVQPVGGKVLPRCETKNVTVGPDTVSQVDISCDSGIR